jgi:hypothetical protein
MKEFIRKLLKERLTEVEFAPHFYERSEDRLWGNKPEGPASINAPAYEGNYVNRRDLLAYNEKLKSLYTAYDVPLVSDVDDILKVIDKIAPITFKVKNKGIGIILWSSGVVHTGRNQRPPGGTLLMIVRDNLIKTIQWQPNNDVNIGGGHVTGVDFLLKSEDLLNYVRENGKTTINGEDVLKIIGKFVEEKPKEDIISINGTKYVIADRETGDLKQKNSGKIILFDDLPEDIQLQVLDILG